MNIFKKKYMPLIIATIYFTFLFIAWMWGYELSRVSIFCLFIGAITGNLSAVIICLSKDALSKNVVGTVEEIIKSMDDKNKLRHNEKNETQT